MMGSTLVIAGYSGNDIDVFPFLRSSIEKDVFNEVNVVNLELLSKNEHFYEIRDRIKYHNEAAEDFLCRLASITPPSGSHSRQKNVSAIVPNEDKYPAALFFGDCLLQLGLSNNLAFKIFFLTQDIVEEETGDLRQLCISHFAKSIALFDIRDNSWGEEEYSAGRTMLHALLNNSDLNKYKSILAEFGRSLAGLEVEASVQRRYGTSYFGSGRLMPRGPDRFDDSLHNIEFLHIVLLWELRARIRACFSALAFAARIDCSEQMRNSMLAVAEKLMHGFEKWDTYFKDRESAYELPILPVFYSKYFKTLRSLISKSERGLPQDLNECISLSRRWGFYIGTSHCYFLKKKYGNGLSEVERADSEAIQKYCGLDEQTMIAPLYRSGDEPFSLSITTYRPPIGDTRNAAF
jgi:hypothetical protein